VAQIVGVGTGSILAASTVVAQARGMKLVRRMGSSAFVVKMRSLPRGSSALGRKCAAMCAASRPRESRCSQFDASSPS
jgi:hypothetical protein